MPEGTPLTSWPGLGESMRQWASLVNVLGSMAGPKWSVSDDSRRRLRCVYEQSWVVGYVVGLLLGKHSLHVHSGAA